MNISAAATIILATTATISLFLQSQFSSSVYVHLRPPKEGADKIEANFINNGRRQAYIHLTNFTSQIGKNTASIKPHPSRLPEPFLIAADSIAIIHLPIDIIKENPQTPIKINISATVIISGRRPTSKNIEFTIFE